MSTWRRLALEQFPELAKEDVPLNAPFDVYYELSKYLEEGIRSGNSELVQRVISFALWGTRQTKDERFVHVTYDLFQRIVESPTLRASLWRELKPQQFEALKRYFYDDYSIRRQTPLKEIEHEYRFTPRPNSALDGGRAKKRLAAQRGR